MHPDNKSQKDKSMKLVTLEDKYVATTGRVYLNGIQALVRLMLVQQQRDAAQGLKTGGFVSGYRGSPLGGLDDALWKATPYLDAQGVKFVPGVNEELAATAVWGTQQVHLTGQTGYDGIFGLWYGKGPGVDRCGDVFKHMNYHGTSKHGGVLLVAGDDHGAYSSTLPHQSDHLFSASMIPVLYPSNVEEYLTLGLHGFAMSRFSGCAVGFKALADTVESSASIDANVHRQKIIVPEDFSVPEGGLNCRLSSETLGIQARNQEALMQDYKIYAALAYSRANQLNHVTIDSPNAKIGIVASGKSYMDVLEALDELGISESEVANVGIRLFKVTMPWPLEPDGIREFSRGLEEILVVEEKRQMVEYQLKEQLYNWDPSVRPKIIGKFDDKGEWVHNRGEWLLPAKADFSVAQIARVIAKRVNRFHKSDKLTARLGFLDSKDAALKRAKNTPNRPAWYCSGCPHNTSTKVPKGSLALAGIGCHVMATAIYPEHNKTMSQMGGEGVTWIGQAPFSKRKHVFANLGDGTYFHSGSLAIRAALAAGINITYKILYNDAVAMTGGQPIDGTLTVPMIANQLYSEGIKEIVVVTEEPNQYQNKNVLNIEADIVHRDLLGVTQERLRNVKGVSVLIFDQTCAAEKRRRRKTGELPKLNKRLFINTDVCEGCGDCGIQSNCTSILPSDTKLGRKREIDQSSCNQDYSCVKGFCPSFVTIEGGTPKKHKLKVRSYADRPNLPTPNIPRLHDDPFNIFITGIGGTGVITVGALLGMAAHLEEKRVSVLDMTGMSQKNGAVTSHVRITQKNRAIRAQRIATGEADLLFGCDMLTAGGQDAISKTRTGRTTAIINTHDQPTGAFTQDRDWSFPDVQLKKLINESVENQATFINATQIATRLLGDSIATNLFMLGIAFQKGNIPLKEASIIKAIELNGVAIDANKEAFQWGRYMVIDEAFVLRIAIPKRTKQKGGFELLNDVLSDRMRRLTQYQNREYANRYKAHITRTQEQINSITKDQSLCVLYAKNLFHLMAYKDEYEVARMYADPAFMESLNNSFDGKFKVRFNLAPPLISKRDEKGHLVKSAYGSWMIYAFRLIAKLKIFRGTAFDLFGKTEERKKERRLITDYVLAVEESLTNPKPFSKSAIRDLIGLPSEVRGFGHVKLVAIEHFYARLNQIRNSCNEGN
ncbi:indolepyruvate ferredoxin oxidoreductase family protein [Burkholderiales bacterium]|nr:indolepyruvate ferredoxin oxidoreductase family protein [Burkholderiales bacterium]